jgi:hypothetical protein
MGQANINQFQFGVGGMPIIYPNNMAETGYSLRANFGFFPSRRLAIGILPFTGKVEDMQGLGANFYSRYYFVNRKFSFFLEGAVGLGTIQYESTPQLNGLLNTINLGPGLSYRLSEVFKLELLLQFARLVNISFPEQTYTGDILIPSIGVQYYMKQ